MPHPLMNGVGVPHKCRDAEGMHGLAVNETGGVPAGNMKGNTTWSIRRSAPKPELKLTPGKGLQDLTCSVEDLVDQVVKTNKVSQALFCYRDSRRPRTQRINPTLTMWTLHEDLVAGTAPCCVQKHEASVQGILRSHQGGRHPSDLTAWDCRW